MKFEYQVINTQMLDFGKELNKMGDDGWEAVCIYNNNFLILKRCKTLLKKEVK